MVAQLLLRVYTRWSPSLPRPLLLATKRSHPLRVHLQQERAAPRAPGGMVRHIGSACRRPGVALDGSTAPAEPAPMGQCHSSCPRKKLAAAPISRLPAGAACAVWSGATSPASCWQSATPEEQTRAVHGLAHSRRRATGEHKGDKKSRCMTVTKYPAGHSHVLSIL